jgi:hypothetical protein
VTALEVYLVAVAHIGAVIAVAYWWYYRRSPWHDYATGPALMWKARSLAALFTLAVVGYWWPFPGYAYLYAGVVTLVVGSMGYQFRVMRRLQRGPNPHF